MNCYETRKVWSVLLRLYHWSLVLSIVTLVVTGFYINNPWTGTTLEGSVAFPVTVIRYFHFLAGYLFAAAVAIRIFLFFCGNRHERIWSMLPITRDNISSLVKTICFYSYISDKHDNRLGHNVLAGMTYVLIITIAVFQLISGFYLLYPEIAGWQILGNNIFGSQQEARLIHHLSMWFFIIFAFVHIYMVVWNDIRSSEGLISSIFTGKKFKHKNV